MTFDHLGCDQRIRDLTVLLAILAKRNGGQLAFSEAELDEYSDPRTAAIAVFREPMYHRIILEAS